MKIDKNDDMRRLIENPFGLSILGWGIVCAILYEFMKSFFRR